jgi:hypothetical protein
VPYARPQDGTALCSFCREPIQLTRGRLPHLPGVWLHLASADIDCAAGEEDVELLIPPVWQQIPREWLGEGGLMAQEISADSWLNEDRFVRLRQALLYAGRKSAAIPALADISPERAALLFATMHRGWLLAGPDL